MIHEIAHWGTVLAAVLFGIWCVAAVAVTLFGIFAVLQEWLMGPQR